MTRITEKDFPLLAGSDNDRHIWTMRATAQRPEAVLKNGSGRFLYKEKCQSAPRAL